MNKKVTSIVLALCMIVSCFAFGSVSVSAASTTDNSVSASVTSVSTAANYGLASQVKDGNILHCFDWKYNDIKAELKNIAEAGFTTIQTSPVANSDPLNQWYGLYLPLAFRCDGHYLGSRSELQALCAEADNYGIKVICDVVANHLSGDHNIIQDDLKDSKYWHTWGGVPDDKWGDRGWVTNGEIGMADLKTEDSYVQQVVYNYLLDLKSLGVDGFRFDAAKHIGLPSEGDNFWKKMSQTGLFSYGEILDEPGGNGDAIMKEYADYIGVTDSVFSGTVMGAIRDGRVDSSNGNWVNRGVAADKIVYWGESHDTYSNNGGWTKNIDQNKVDRAYAVVAARANSQSLYLSRPPFSDKEQIMAGQKGSTHFTAKEIAAVNHFHNAMIGTNEYYTTSDNCFVVCRGGGAVIVAANGSNFSVTVPNGGGIVPSGDYTDEVTGNHWTVNGSTMSGQIGSSGIAVIYNAKPAGPSVSAVPGTSTYKTDTLNVTLSYSEATSGTYSIDGGAAQSFTGSKTVTIGQGKDYGTRTTITVTATNGTDTDSETYTYTKVDPNATQTVYFDNSSYNWSQVYCYMYIEGGTVSNGQWPGVLMTQGNNNIYQYDVPSGLENALCIFTETNDATTNRYPADGETGMSLDGNSMMFGANHSWDVYTGGTPTPTQGTNPVQPTQPTNPPAGKVLIGDVDFNGRITVKDATLIQIHLAEMQQLSTEAQAAADVNQDTLLTVKDVTVLQRYLADFSDSTCYAGKYTDGSEPETQPTQPTTPVTGQTIYFDNNAYGWSNVYCYIYNDSDSAAAWPGAQMTRGSDNVYYLSVPSGYENGYAMFAESETSSNRYPADMEPGLPIGGKSMELAANHSWVEYGTQPSTEPTQPTQPVTDPVEDSCIYFRNVYSWGTVYAHMWNSNDTSQGTTWNGTQMTHVGNGVWRVDVPSGYNMVVFNDGSNQTDDLSMVFGNVYDDTNHTWTPFDGGTHQEDPQGRTIIFSDNMGWGSVKIHYWGGSSESSWPGVAMTSIGTNYLGETQYSAVIPSDSTGVVFNNGSSQTVDVTDLNHYGFYLTSQNGEGKWEVGTWDE